MSLLRLGAGPLALAGFFLPWATGPGPFAATDFTGFTLVGFAGRLQALDLSVTAGAMLWAVRLAILGVVVAATWQSVLAPRHHGHFGYPASGWYLVAAAAVLLVIGILRTGLVVPPAGFGMIVAAAGCFLVSRLARTGHDHSI